MDLLFSKISRALDLIGELMSAEIDYLIREYKRSDAYETVSMLNLKHENPCAVVDAAENIRHIRYVPISSSKVVVEDANGRIVGYAYVADKENSFVFETGCGVHPEHQESGVGSMLLKWAQDKASALNKKGPNGIRSVLQVNIFESDLEMMRLVENEGFSRMREWSHYEIQLTEAPAQNFFEGIKIRPFNHDWDLAGPVMDAAFIDHWGAYSLPSIDSPDTIENDKSGNKEDVEDDSYSNADGYCFIAFAEDDVAGGILCNARLVEFKNTGCVGSVFVNPKYRRLGVGRGLMLSAFNAFWQSGVRRVILDTDSQSFSDSEKFYTGLGMNIYRREFLYEKEIRSGREIRRLQR